MQNAVTLSAVQAALAALYVLNKLGNNNATQLKRFVDACPPLANSGDAFEATNILAAELVDAANGVDSLLEMIGASVPPQKADTVYWVNATFVAQYGRVSPEEMRFLERLGETLNIERLSRAAYDRAAQAGAVALGETENE